MQNLTSNLTLLPPFQKEYVVTYNDMLQTLAGQLSDRMYFLAWVFLSYVILNMYVFKEDARFRPYFERLFAPKYEILNNPLGTWVFYIVQSLALASAIMLVMLNIIYRMGLKI